MPLAQLAQLHAGFANRPSYAPWSVVLCGLRNVRDYREAAGKDPEGFGSASPFNIKVESVPLWASKRLADQLSGSWGPGGSSRHNEPWQAPGLTGR